MYYGTFFFLIYAVFFCVDNCLITLLKIILIYASLNSDRRTTMAYVTTDNLSVLKHILLESLIWNSFPGLLHRYCPGISFPSDPRNSFWLYFGNLVFSESQVFLFCLFSLIVRTLPKKTYMEGKLFKITHILKSLLLHH